MAKNIKPKKVRILVADPDLPPVREDFRRTIAWRIFRIISEFVEGFQFLADVKNGVAVFGSTKAKPKDKYYQEAVRLGKGLVKEGFTVITGGGPGIMEAANKGAFGKGSDSVGLNIELPAGQRMNQFVERPIGFHYFFIRKVMFSFASYTYCFFPGGFGTLNEFFEMVSLVQTKKLPGNVIIIAVGKEYWEPLFDWIKNELYLKRRAINKEDLKIFKLVDSAQECIEIIKKQVKTS